MEVIKLKGNKGLACFVAGQRITLRTDKCIDRLMRRFTSAAQVGRSSTGKLDVSTVSAALFWFYDSLLIVVYSYPVIYDFPLKVYKSIIKK